MQETNWKQAGSELKIEQTKSNHEVDDIPKTCHFCFLLIFLFIFLDFFFFFVFSVWFFVGGRSRSQSSWFWIHRIYFGFSFYDFFFFGHLCVVFSSIEVHAWVYFTMFGCEEDGGKERKRKKNFDCIWVVFHCLEPKRKWIFSWLRWLHLFCLVDVWFDFCETKTE